MHLHTQVRNPVEAPVRSLYSSCPYRAVSPSNCQSTTLTFCIPYPNLPQLRSCSPLAYTCSSAARRLRHDRRHVKRVLPAFSLGALNAPYRHACALQLDASHANARERRSTSLCTLIVPRTVGPVTCGRLRHELTHVAGHGLPALVAAHCEYGKGCMYTRGVKRVS